MTLLQFETSDNRKMSINPEYIVLVYPHPLNMSEGPVTLIGDVSGSRTAVKGTYNAIVSYISSST